MVAIARVTRQSDTTARAFHCPSRTGRHRSCFVEARRAAIGTIKRDELRGVPRKAPSNRAARVLLPGSPAPDARRLGPAEQVATAVSASGRLEAVLASRFPQPETFGKRWYTDPSADQLLGCQRCRSGAAGSLGARFARATLACPGRRPRSAQRLALPVSVGYLRFVVPGREPRVVSQAEAPRSSA